jgi:hypothetical protein
MKLGKIKKRSGLFEEAGAFFYSCISWIRISRMSYEAAMYAARRIAWQ